MCLVQSVETVVVSTSLVSRLHGSRPRDREGGLRHVGVFIVPPFCEGVRSLWTSFGVRTTVCVYVLPCVFHDSGSGDGVNAPVTRCELSVVSGLVLGPVLLRQGPSRIPVPL